MELGQKFFPSDLVFPLGFLVDALEHRNYEFGTQDNLWVLRVFTEIGVTFPQLFDIYASLEVIIIFENKTCYNLIFFHFFSNFFFV